MDADGRKQLDAEHGDLVLVRERSRRWSLVGLLVVLVVCGTTLVCFAMRGQMASDREHEHDLRHSLRQISENAKAAIHLEGEYDQDENVLRWQDAEGQTFSQGGLKLEDNTIVIPRSGLYFVYSQASFRVNCHKASPEEREHLSHTIMRRSDSYGNVLKPLLNAVRSTCKQVRDHHDNGNRWFNAIYLGAVFSLNEGDQLSTITNHKPDIESEDGKTFFGVFAL